MANKVKRKYSIGIFDSGLGGIQILKHIAKELPEYNYVYLGDTARVPYGNRSQEVIYDFTVQAVDFLLRKGCHLIIFACNTVSSKALQKIQREYLPKRYPGKKVLGVIIPVSEEAVSKTKNKRIGVIATQGTVSSGAFNRELGKLDPEIKIFQQACPLLVPIVEAGEEKSKVAEWMLQKYLKPILRNKVDTLILGCTHYRFFEGKIRKIIGKKIQLIDEGRIVARKLRDYLTEHRDIEKLLGRNSELKFFTTDLTKRFEGMGSKFFGKKIKPKKIVLE